VPRTIDQVLAALDVVVDRCWEEDSRLGYFPAMYRTVTAQIRDGVQGGDFEDCERMERLDVVFASRYLDAYDAHRSGVSPTRSWAYSFEQAGRAEPTVLHHLLLGMNAHINLDLAIAAAEVSHGTDIDTLEGDFRQVNEVLTDLVDEVQDAVDDTSVLYRGLDLFGLGIDEAVASFSIKLARDGAWVRAGRLHEAGRDAMSPLIDRYDVETVRLARTITPLARVIGRIAAADLDGPPRPRAVIETLSRTR
jgi:hypothetical protein